MEEKMKNQYYFFVLLILLISCSDCISMDDCTRKKKLEINENSTVVCFGDSLTYGHGADKIEDSYPMIIQKWIKIPVINAGINDATTEIAKNRFNKDVLEKNPVIIIFNFGGNDIYNSNPQLSIKQIESNFKYMFDQIDFNKTDVFLLRYYNNQMRFLDVFFSFDRMLDRLEKHYDVKIIRDIWKGVWGHEEMKYNMTHPNSKGYKIIAQNVFQEIKTSLEYNNLLIE